MGIYLSLGMNEDKWFVLKIRVIEQILLEKLAGLLSIGFNPKFLGRKLFLVSTDVMNCVSREKRNKGTAIRLAAPLIR